MKQLTNQMCRERGLTVAEKGKNFDGKIKVERDILRQNSEKARELMRIQKQQIQGIRRPVYKEALCTF